MLVPAARVCGWCLWAPLVVSCGGTNEGGANAGRSTDAVVTVADSLPQDVRIATLAAASDMDENSAAAASVAHPGIVFTINDSGNEPELFAFDTTGADRGRWRIEGATNRDWEAVAVARCTPARDDWCVFIGDVGDNALRRSSISIYRVPEPRPLAAGEGGSLRADVLVARYPDGAHNVEAMIVVGNGAVQLMTKERRRGSARVPSATLVYEIAAQLWGSATPADATLIDSLPIAPDRVERYEVTDAALSPDRTVLLVRTPSRLFAFGVDSLTARLLPGRPPATCDVAKLREAQGEGVGVLHTDSATARLVLTSEGSREPLRLATCPIPPR